MDHHPARIGIHPLKSDPCICVVEDHNGFVILMLLADDVLLLGADKQLLNKIKTNLRTV